MATMVIPPPYRGPTRGLERVEIPAGTVRGCIEAVDARHPGFAEQVLDEKGRVHRFVKLFRNGEQLQGDVLDEKIGADDRLEVLAAIAGG
jgi:sulfur carrier protein ThiS